MKSLNATQQKIFDFLVERTCDGIPPSVREIGKAVGLSSTSSVQAGLEALEEKGYITRDPLHKRSIRINGMERENILQVPLVGVVTAGAPILALEQIDCYIPYSGPIPRDEKIFALRVRGESMLNAGIFDGDIIFVKQTPVAHNGEIVVALVGEEATVKTFYKEKGHFRLQPENEAYAPIIVDEVAILGKVIALTRYYP